ncbi:MAG: DUF2842 domain-containing protein [Pseudomonadota bacterium]
MKPRIKKLIGVCIIVPAIFIYLAAAAALGVMVPDFWLLKLAYYVVAGVIWAFPLKHLMKWMNAEPPASPSR